MPSSRGIDMPVAEYDYDVGIAVQREEALPEGESEGFSSGKAKGLQ